ncbi:uncharacterized protein LOC120357549 [Solenopsis invicta]|uniref:uncharacterized protein LOC120357549 n=1 Tax=Solenopsis invicta TaxID=13686 RepID=UPI00193E477D|nr:uncharacterized protein LOC120357549 [Solenopsis invicta]
MKTLIFVACILAAVSAGNILDHIIKISEIFDIKEVIDFYKTLEECALELNISEIATPETLYCLIQKKNLVDEEGGINWDKGIIYRKKLIRGSNDIIAKWVKIIHQCREENRKESNTFKGRGYETAMKFMKCLEPFVNYGLKELILFQNYMTNNIN